MISRLVTEHMTKTDSTHIFSIIKGSILNTPGHRPISGCFRLDSLIQSYLGAGSRLLPFKQPVLRSDMFSVLRDHARIMM